jgi:hypothetical protein
MRLTQAPPTHPYIRHNQSQTKSTHQEPPLGNAASHKNGKISSHPISPHTCVHVRAMMRFYAGPTDTSMYPPHPILNTEVGNAASSANLSRETGVAAPISTEATTSQGRFYLTPQEDFRAFPAWEICLTQAPLGFSCFK